MPYLIFFLPLDNARPSSSKDTESDVTIVENTNPIPPIPVPTEKPRDTPAQNKTKETIAEYNKQLVSLVTLKNSGMSLVTEKQIRDLKDKIHEEEMELKK